MTTTAFLNKNFKPIMMFYYKKRFCNEIHKVLSFFHDHKEAGEIDTKDAIKIMTLDNDGWTLRKAAKIVGMCIYCGFIEPAK